LFTAHSVCGKKPKTIEIRDQMKKKIIWVGESFFDYEYLREFKVKIGTARNVV
jgi:hypothetical protein